RLDEVHYTTSASDEIFLQYIDADRNIAGFLRLSLPSLPPITPELDGAAIIREVHVYGQSVEIGEASAGKTQHAGLGTRLIERAAAIAAARGFARLAVISAVGTRGYYRGRGFEDGELYQVRALKPPIGVNAVSEKEAVPCPYATPVLFATDSLGGLLVVLALV